MSNKQFWPQPGGDHVYDADDHCIYCDGDADDVFNKPCNPKPETVKRNGYQIALWKQQQQA